MADSASESDTDAAGGGPAAMQSSCSATSGGSGGGGGGKSGGIVISPFRLEELTNRLASLQQENKVLKIELETYKLKCKALQEENRDLRKASVTIVSGTPRTRGATLSARPRQGLPACGRREPASGSTRALPPLGCWRCLGRPPTSPLRPGWRPLRGWAGGWRRGLGGGVGLSQSSGA